MIIETTEYNIKIPVLILSWYFIEMPKKILLTLVSYVKSISFIYSFKFLLQTLFSPWKNQLESYPSKGFDLKRLIEVFSANLISRMVGLIIRVFVLVFGSLVELITLLTGLTVLTIWYVGPIILIFLPVILLRFL